MTEKKGLIRDLTAAELAARLDPQSETRAPSRCPRLARLLFAASLGIGLVAGARVASADVQIKDWIGTEAEAMKLANEKGYLLGYTNEGSTYTANTGNPAFDQMFNGAFANGFMNGQNAQLDPNLQPNTDLAFAEGFYDSYAATMSGQSIVVNPYEPGTAAADAYNSGVDQGISGAQASPRASLDVQPNSQLNGWDFTMLASYSDPQAAYTAGLDLGQTFAALGNPGDTVVADTGNVTEDTAFADGYDTADPGCASCASCTSAGGCSSCSSGCGCSCGGCGCSCG